MNTTNDSLLTLAEFCQPLHITIACARRWIMERKITTVKIGRLVRIPQSELERIVKNGMRPALQKMDTTTKGERDYRG